MNKENLIYILDRDLKKREAAESVLQGDLFETRGFSALDALFQALSEMPCALLLLDLSSCGEGGLHTAFARLMPLHVPVIALQREENVMERITALTVGADLCLSKEAFWLPELSASVKALLRRVRLERRHAAPACEPICYGDIWLDPLSRSAFVGDASLNLTPHEFVFLKTLFQHSGAVRKETLSASIWGENALELCCRAVDDLVKRLRKKLKQCESSVQIVSVRAYGYRPDTAPCPGALPND